MTDIVERLTEPDYWISGYHSGGDDCLDCTPFEAAREIKRLREDIASADAQIEALEAKLGPDCCACSYDYPGDVCMVHSPMLRKAEADNKRLREALIRIGQERGGHMGEHHALCQEIALEALAKLKEDDDD